MGNFACSTLDYSTSLTKMFLKAQKREVQKHYLINSDVMEKIPQNIVF